MTFLELDQRGLIALSLLASGPDDGNCAAQHDPQEQTGMSLEHPSKEIPGRRDPIPRQLMYVSLRQPLRYFWQADRAFVLS